jgi:hypothetical protein
MSTKVKEKGGILLVIVQMRSLMFVEKLNKPSFILLVVTGVHGNCSGSFTIQNGTQHLCFSTAMETLKGTTWVSRTSPESQHELLVHDLPVCPSPRKLGCFH